MAANTQEMCSCHLCAPRSPKGRVPCCYSAESFDTGDGLSWDQNAALIAVLNSTCVALGVVGIKALALGKFLFSYLFSLKISAPCLLSTALQKIPLNVMGECVGSEMLSFQPGWVMVRLEDGHGEVNGTTSREWEFHLLWVGVLSLVLHNFGDCLWFSSAFLQSD